MSRLAQLKRDNPDFEVDEQITATTEQIDQLHKIKTVGDSEGGQELVKLLLQDVRGNVSRLTSMYRTATHLELLAVISQMESKLDLARLITNAKEGQKILEEQLEEALRE